MILITGATGFIGRAVAGRWTFRPEIFARCLGADLSAENGWQLYIPAGFAHGFMTLTDEVVFGYKCTDYYAPAAERTVRWDDPGIAIEWPVGTPILAPKNAAAPLLAEIPTEKLPRYQSANA